MKDKIDNEYIRDGVKLADGWEINEDEIALPNGMGFCSFYHSMGIPELVRSALVAQLKSQVDETKWKLHEYPDQTIICYKNDAQYTIHKGEGRTMNTLKTILDSRVLVME